MARSHRIARQLGPDATTIDSPDTSANRPPWRGSKPPEIVGAKDLKLEDIPPKDSAGEFSNSVDADKKEGGIVRTLVKN
jgi:hypothetical protein